MKMKLSTDLEVRLFVPDEKDLWLARNESWRYLTNTQNLSSSFLNFTTSRICISHSDAKAICRVVKRTWKADLARI